MSRFFFFTATPRAHHPPPPPVVVFHRFTIVSRYPVAGTPKNNTISALPSPITPLTVHRRSKTTFTITFTIHTYNSGHLLSFSPFFVVFSQGAVTAVGYCSHCEFDTQLLWIGGRYYFPTFGIQTLKVTANSRSPFCPLKNVQFEFLINLYPLPELTFCFEYIINS